MEPEVRDIVERFLVALVSLTILAAVLIAPAYFFGWLGGAVTVVLLLSLSFALDDI